MVSHGFGPGTVTPGKRGSIFFSSSHFFLSITSKIPAVEMSAMSTPPDLRLSSRVAWSRVARTMTV